MPDEQHQQSGGTPMRLERYEDRVERQPLGEPVFSRTVETGVTEDGVVLHREIGGFVQTADGVTISDPHLVAQCMLCGLNVHIANVLPLWMLWSPRLPLLPQRP